MPYKELKKALQERLGITRQAVDYRVKGIKKRYGPMSSEEAIGVEAHLNGLDISKYLEPLQVQVIRQLVHQISVSQSTEAPKTQAATVRVVNVTIAGEFKLSDPLLPERVLRDAKAMTKVYAELYVFENSVREVIKLAMSKENGSGWWDTCVPEGIRAIAESRIKDENRNQWHGKRGGHPICYVDMSDLGKIIQARWSVFKDLFPSQAWVSERIREIARSRNVVDHHNPLGREDQKRISIFFADWCRQITYVKSQLM